MKNVFFRIRFFIYGLIVGLAYLGILSLVDLIDRINWVLYFLGALIFTILLYPVIYNIDRKIFNISTNNK